MVMTPVPLYHCIHCAGRVWWRVPPAPWNCSACSPWWADATIAAVIDETPAGIRPALAYADAPIVAHEHMLDCRSAERFLRAIAART